MSEEEKAKTGFYFELKFDLKTLITLLIVVIVFCGMYIDASVQEEKVDLLHDQVRNMMHEKYDVQRLLDQVESEHKKRLKIIEERLNIKHY